MLPVGAKLPLAGSYSSVVAPGSVLFTPPVTSTFPLFSRVAVWWARTVAMLPVALKPCGNTSIVTSSGADTCPTPSVTVTLIGYDPSLVGVPARVPSVPNDNPGGSGPLSLQGSGPKPL